jgi:ABC-type branched-subunit amino acid transport system permease subunit
MTFRALRGAAGWGMAIVVLAGLPHVLPVYHQFVASLTLVNAVAAMGVNLSMGYGGQVSIGHAGFVAIGAYTAAVLMTKLGVTYWLTLPLGGALAALAGFLIGLPALRLSHLYIGMVTFGFGQAIGFVALNWVALTNGPNGIAVPPVMVGSFMFTPDTFYYVIAAVFLALFWIGRNLVTSRIGRSFLALRESETAAEAMGVNLVRYKTMAFAVGAAYGGVAGSLYAGLSQFVNPDAFVFLVSVLYLTMNVVGGMGTLAGPVLGAVIFTVMPELLRAFAEYKEFLSGALLLGLMVFFPRGLVGILGPAWMRLARRFSRRAPPLPARSSVVDEA